MAEAMREAEHEEIPAELWMLRDSNGQWVRGGSSVARAILVYESEDDAYSDAAEFHFDENIESIPVRVK